MMTAIALMKGALRDEAADCINAGLAKEALRRRGGDSRAAIEFPAFSRSRSAHRAGGGAG
jgi:hypothetical protein